MSNLNIGVVGAGVIGLTTAIELKNEFPNAKITVLAEKFTEETTSNVAAGVFRPGTNFSGPNDEITRKWINDSFNYWENIWHTSYGPSAGVTEISAYLFSSIHEGLTRNQFIEKLVPVYRRATEEELQLCPGNWKYGSFFTTLLIENGIYLPWAMNKLTSLNGNIQKMKINSFSDLHDQKYDVIVNCTGLGAKYLCNDRKLVPIRGQIIKVNAPFLKTCFYGDFDTYIVPGFKTVTLGGTRQFESYNLSVNRYDTMAIYDRCTAMVPSLKSAPIVKHCVGLRPYRDQVRVEKEIMHLNNGNVKIVHNYGHGGYGVTTAPGTSLYAVKLIKEILAGNSKL